MQASKKPNHCPRYTGPVLADWSGVAAWKRAFLDAAAAQRLHKYYTVPDYADPEAISPARRAEIHAAAEVAVAPVAHELPSAAFRAALLARTHAIILHVDDTMATEAAAVQARTVAAAVSFLLSALSPHLCSKLGMCKSPYELWASLHAKGNVLMDDCRFFGLLENVRLADDDALPDGLTRVEEHIQRFVDVIFVPSHGSDARLVAAADRLKMALLCNACPPAMVDVFETWRADEPAWDYAYMRRRLVEHWTSSCLDLAANDSLAPAGDTLQAHVRAAVGHDPATATSADGRASSLRAAAKAIDRDVDGSEDDMGAARDRRR
ncbi:hypothetical protein SDRG_16210 [Saprolegnia diclina VS20]|uniref:Uncharacterized protein n=1 Tax=Saprolegnia diclina (strain VS20) TaxID=1156394 RepID=T0R1U5_SAPDV|nr:hypothetical protein SDRG_16210 [Saprolegnia diclina VS20]EQC25953.1 hypothetical protein SDRG_16210 [Saprolegnia diclina VS20]|eukprot:XP_008620633.1 hypothetical protein SDRG_16210 [Saprolegnia diclina VS20]